MKEKFLKQKVGGGSTRKELLEEWVDWLKRNRLPLITPKAGQKGFKSKARGQG
ncbi:MAG: hypothetical protein AB1468_02670 [Candidatus Micrarchaeota archaeon]